MPNCFSISQNFRLSGQPSSNPGLHAHPTSEHHQWHRCVKNLPNTLSQWGGGAWQPCLQWQIDHNWWPGATGRRHPIQGAHPSWLGQVVTYYDYYWLAFLDAHIWWSTLHRIFAIVSVMIEQDGGGQYFQLITTDQDAIDYNSVISYYNWSGIIPIDYN